MSSYRIAIVSAGHSGVSVPYIMVGKSPAQLQEILVEWASKSEDNRLGSYYRAYCERSASETLAALVVHFNHGFQSLEDLRTYTYTSMGECGAAVCRAERPTWKSLGL